MNRSSSLRRSARLKPRSRKSRAQDREYAEVRDRVRRAAFGLCQLVTDVCAGIGEEPHHLKGRDGGRLTDERWLRWTCRPCHDYAHAHPTESYERGWLVKRNGSAA